MKPVLYFLCLFYVKVCRFHFHFHRQHIISFFVNVKNMDYLMIYTHVQIAIYIHVFVDYCRSSQTFLLYLTISLTQGYIVFPTRYSQMAPSRSRFVKSRKLYCFGWVKTKQNFVVSNGGKGERYRIVW